MACSGRILCRQLITQHLRLKTPNYFHARTLLSEAYYCEERWQARLQADVFRKVDVGDYVVRLQDKFDREGSVSAVDMDILVNKFEKLPRKQLDFAQSLIYKFRHTNECLKMPDSTPHALIRGLMQLQEYERLWSILNDKINYGIFLDHFTANYLMNHFLKNKMYEDAARVAYDLMLQEDFSNRICRVLAWYSCHMRWKHPPEAEVKADTTESVDDDDEEEKAIKVAFIENPWYDDHFDIPHELWLLGKSLCMIAGSDSSILGVSYSLIGCGLYEKFEKGLILLENLIKSGDPNMISLEALEDFHARLESVNTKEAVCEVKPPGEQTLQDWIPYVTPEQRDSYLHRYQELVRGLQQSGVVMQDFDLGGELLRHVTAVIATAQHEDISQQEALFTHWEEKRLNMIAEQVQEYKLSQQRDALAKRLHDVRERELRISFFDNSARIREMTARGKKLEELEKLFQSEEYLHWAPRT